jgi:hypothetical protein
MKEQMSAEELENMKKKMEQNKTENKMQQSDEQLRDSPYFKIRVICKS